MAKSKLTVKAKPRVKPKAKHKGYVIDQGFSPIDSKPYVVIATLVCVNRKTGPMVQVWILREDINPVEGVNTGEDVSICGTCPHRKNANGERSCYVNVGQAPNSVWKSYKRGIYSTDHTDDDLAAVLKGRKIRWGAYGDPAIINPTVVRTLNSYAKGHTGYTHMWGQDYAKEFLGLFQASCDSLADYIEASSMGWRTFQVTSKNTRLQNAIQCPATRENSKTQCITCTLCDGNTKDIYVEAHGSGAKYVAYA
jgi:hypothetical protein